MKKAKRKDDEARQLTQAYKKHRRSIVSYDRKAGSGQVFGPRGQNNVANQLMQPPPAILQSRIIINLYSKFECCA